MQILWLPEARDDIARLHRFLVGKSSRASSAAIRVILKGVDQLSDHPFLGRPMDDDTGRRELFLPSGASAYVLRYRIYDDQIIIIRVWHSRENRL